MANPGQPTISLGATCGRRCEATGARAAANAQSRAHRRWRLRTATGDGGQAVPAGRGVDRRRDRRSGHVGGSARRRADARRCKRARRERSSIACRHCSPTARRGSGTQRRKGSTAISGPNTKASVVAFQAWGGVVQDGVVGDQTWAVSLHAASATLETAVGLQFVIG